MGPSVLSMQYISVCTQQYKTWGLLAALKLSYSFLQRTEQGRLIHTELCLLVTSWTRKWKKKFFCPFSEKMAKNRLFLSSSALATKTTAQKWEKKKKETKSKSFDIKILYLPKPYIAQRQRYTGMNDHMLNNMTYKKWGIAQIVLKGLKVQMCLWINVIGSVMPLRPPL